MPSVSSPKTTVILVLLVAISLLSGSSIVAGSQTYQNSSAEAEPPLPGQQATHTIIVGTNTTPEETIITGLRLTYSRSANQPLVGVQLQDIEFEILRNATSTPRVQPVYAERLTITNHSIQARFYERVTILPGDAIRIRIQSAKNPATVRNTTITTTLNHQGQNRTTAKTTLAFYQPPPEFVGASQLSAGQRISYNWYANVSGFIVAQTEGGRTVGISHEHPNVSVHTDTALSRLIDTTNVEKPATITLTAYNDTNRNGEFDPHVDAPFQRDGENVSITAKYAGPTTTTTTTTQQHTSHDNMVTEPIPTTHPAETPGFGIPTVLIATLTLFALLRRHPQ